MLFNFFSNFVYYFFILCLCERHEKCTNTKHCCLLTCTQNIIIWPLLEICPFIHVLDLVILL